MYKILFVCHGNICRSPMAEYIFGYEMRRRELTGALAQSAATSTEEIGNGVHYGTAAVLKRLGIDYSAHRARQITPADFREYDLIVGMDSANIRNIMRFSGAADGCEICRLLDFTENPRDISDPWYTGDFEQTYADVSEGCAALIERLLRQGRVRSARS